MTIYDLIIAIIVFGFMLWGFFRGFLRELFSILGIICGVWGAFMYAPILAPKLPVNIYPMMELASAGIILFLAGVLVFKILFWIIHSLFIHGTPLKTGDRIAGLIFGGIKAIVLILAIVIPLTFTPFAAKLEAASRQSTVSALSWTLSVSKSIGKRLGSEMISLVTDKVEKALPNAGVGYKPESIQTLIEEAVNKEEGGMARQEIINSINDSKNSLIPMGEKNMSKEQIEKVVDQALKLKASGLSSAESAMVMTDKNLNITKDQIQELIGSVQKIQMSGEKLSKDQLFGGLSDSTRQKLEYLAKHPGLKNLDPVEFARQTGYNVEELVKQYGMEKMFSKFEQMRKK